MTETSSVRLPELLAPAGNMACLHAAVRAGADAVYLGAGHFNARRNADNFTLETLAEACDWAHLRGVKVYLTLNTVVLPSEVPDALELARQAYRCGVDAFIVQDPGMAQELARTLPDVSVHASTQMNVHDNDTLAAAAALGAKRVTLARELSFGQIEELSAEARRLGMETEVFAHGALCVCFSGQCLMSSLVGGRSANRGLCAQACRLPYSLHNRALRKDLPSPGEHLLSPKDLCTAEALPDLAATGVASIKIEGRMKSPEYVFAVTGVYRQLLDQLAAGGNATPDEEQMRVLSEAFSRGFTTAYLEGQRGNGIMSYTRPNNRGVKAGRVTSVKNNVVAVDDDGLLRQGDLIEFWTNRGHFVHDVQELTRARNGEALLRDVARPVGKGDRVFRVRSVDAVFADDAQEPRVPVMAVVRLVPGTPAAMTLSTLPEASGQGPTAPAASVTVEGPIVELARTKALTEDEVRAHIDRMGNTPFVLDVLEVDLADGVGMGFSTLHRLRADAADALQHAMLAPTHARELERVPERVWTPRDRKGSCKVAALATNPACARAAKKAGADLIYVPVHNYRRGQAVIAGQLSATAEQAGYPKQCVPVLPVFSGLDDERDRNGFDLWKRVKSDAPVLCENLGQVLHAGELGAVPEAGPHVPVTNRFDVQLMHDLGVGRVWLSPELSLEQIEELGQVSPVPLGLTVMGQAELMVTEHCLLMSQGPCDEDCERCARRKSPHYLKDRKGFEMPVVTDSTGRSHLYNAVSLDIADKMPELIAAGVSAVMVDTTMMNVSEVSKKVARAVRARDIALRTGDRVSKAVDTTSGHLFRSVG